MSDNPNKPVELSGDEKDQLVETKARYSGLLRDDVVREILDTVPVRL